MTHRPDPESLDEDEQQEGSERTLLALSQDEDIPEDVLRELAEHPKVLQRILSYSYQGPLPPPYILREYDEIVPGSAARIMDEFHDEASHRRTLQNRQADLTENVVASDIHRSWAGLAVAALIALLGLGVAWDLGRQGYQVAAGLIFGTTLVALVANFIYITERRSKEADQTDSRNTSDESGSGAS